MFTAIVQITVPEPLDDEQLRQIFESTSPNYLGLSGLVRKHYLVSQDRRTIGGCYLWRTKEEGERIYTPEWRKFVVERYRGPEPVVTWFESPMVVETALNRIDRFWPSQVAA